MGFDTKNTAKVGGGYGGISGEVHATYQYLTGNLSGQDGTGFNPVGKLSPIAESFRAETSDTLKRRNIGFRGL